MRASSDKDLSVFDFNKDEEGVQNASVRGLRRDLTHGNPKLDASPLTKNHFLECYEWWRNFGIDDLELQNLAIRILSQTCSSSGCERNWSVFERIHTKRRNRLEHKWLNDLVYTHYNLRLKERQSSRKSLTDPISLENIDLTDDWVVEAEDDDAPLLDVDEIDDWMDVADAILDEGEGGAAAVSQTSESPQKGTTGIGCINLDANDGNPKCGLFTCNDRDSCSVGTSGREFSTLEATSELGDILITAPKNLLDSGHAIQANIEPANLISGCRKTDSLAMGFLGVGMPSMDGGQLNCVAEELPSDENLVDVSDDEEILEESSPSTSGSDLSEDGALEQSSSDHCTLGYSEMDNGSPEVAIYPDFVLFSDRVLGEPLLTFSSECFKLEASNANEDGEHISFVYSVGDINSIICHWIQNVEIAWIRLYLSPMAVAGVENALDTSGLVKLEFSVNSSQWFEIQQRVLSLSARYTAIWHVELNAELLREEEYLQQKITVIPEQCFTWEDEPFEDVIYPKGDPDAVSISKRDVELLKPETFINDTIIDFYIKYLKDMIPPEDKNRFHFFNSFFFRKLVDLDKNPGSAAESKAAFQRVRKWTRNVNILEKDYIFVPVNFNLHWSLLVICHLGELAHFKDNEIDKVHKVPCILHMDSIKGSHKGLKDLVQSYLSEEWKERRKEMSESFEDASTKFSNMRFVPLELPQQENLYDCGLFLLHYVELFLKEAPVNFSPLKITKFSKFLNRNWFLPAEASAKRFLIQKLILELHDEHSQTVPPAACSNHQLPSEFLEEESTEEMAVEFISEGSNAARVCLGNSFASTAERGIEMKLLATSRLHNVHDDKETGLVYREFFDSGGTIATSADDQIPPFHKSALAVKCTMTPIEEETETCEADTPYSASREVFYQPAAMDSRGLFRGVEMFCFPQISTRLRENEDMDASTSSDPLSYGSQDSSEDGANGHLSPHRSVDFVGLVEPGKHDKLTSTSSENWECVTGSRSVSSGKLENCIVEESQEDDMMAESKESGDSFFSCQENVVALETGDLPSDCMHCADDDVVPIEKHQAHKRLKLMAAEGENQNTQKASSDQES